jgi:hypothetical protein
MKWFGYNPNPTNGVHFADAPPKDKQSGTKSKKRPVKSPMADQNDSDSEDHSSDAPRKKKRASIDELDAEEEEILKIHVYLNVETPPPPVVRVGNRSVKQPAPKITRRGPFIFDSSATYDDFLAMVAKGAGTHNGCLVRASMEWHFDKPSTSSRKPIMNQVGFEVMVASVCERNKDRMIIISMPPPMKGIEDVVPRIPFFHLHCLIICRSHGDLNRLTKMTESQ